MATVENKYKLKLHKSCIFMYYMLANRLLLQPSMLLKCRHAGRTDKPNPRIFFTYHMISKFKQQAIYRVVNPRNKSIVPP